MTGENRTAPHLPTPDREALGVTDPGTRFDTDAVDRARRETGPEDHLPVH
ncbi:hypothetical protein ACQEVF_13840 [Nonomuraea polychroma]